MKPLALKWRLSIPVALAMAAAMVVICALAYGNFRELVLSQTDRSLVSAGEAIRMVVDDPSHAADCSDHVRIILAAMEDRPRDKDPSEDAGPPELMARVWMGNRGDNTIAIGSDVGLHALTETTRQMTPPAQGQPLPFDITSPEGRSRAVWMRVPLKDGLCNIVVAQTTAEIYDELHELLRDLVLTTLGVVAAVILMSGVLIVLGLRPIRRTAQRLAGITVGNLGQLDWPSRSVPAELVPFVENVSQMLNRLDAAMRQQRTFIADASHELRTPIAVAKSTLQVALATDRSAEEYRQAIQDATDDLRRLEHMVEELLTLARLDETHGLAQVQELNLTELLTDVAESFRPRVSSTGGRVVCDLEPAQVNGDAAQLRMLFSNLLENALRHGPAGGEIRLTLRDQEILVHDQGGNIPADDLPHLFDRFYRADNSRSQSTGGAGLGLAIAKAIVLRHGGEIRIQSDPATGTSVCVRLPIHHRTVPPADRTAKTPQG